MKLLHFRITSILLIIVGDLEISAGESTTLTAYGAETYLWSTGETTASITVSPLTSATYSVTGTNGGHCSKEANVTVNVFDDVEEHEHFDIIITPNPAKNQVTVIGEEIKAITITEITGQQVMKFDDIHEDRFLIDFSDYHQGIYLINVNTESGEKTVRRIVIAR